MTVSMTGFASRQGALGRYAWTWDLRSVNGRGLDLRLRLPDWIEGLEAAVRARLQKAMHRGSVQLSLRVQSSAEAGEVTLDPARLQAMLKIVAETESAAAAADIGLKPSSAADILGLRGMLDGPAREEDTAELRQALEADLELLLEEFKAMRAAEGASLAVLISGQLDEVERLREAAAVAATERGARAPELLKTQIERITGATDAVDADRLAQELALLAVKADVTEELDRLAAHVAAARDLLAGPGPKGRKLDFLVQEFNREANTLCSKSGSTSLTGVGLDLKATIDQMREQIQNVE